MLSIKNLKIIINKKNIINNFNLQVGKNEIVALTGMSGCGKTTILNACANIYKYQGEILLYDKPLLAKDFNIGLVMQDLGLLPWLNVEQNCLLPYKIKKELIDDLVFEKLDLVLTKLNIKEYQQFQIQGLSGGQKQRVAIARLFLASPDIILMDEAFSSLDLLNKDEAIKLFMDIWKENPTPTILVTHSIDEALLMAHKIVVLKEGGVIENIIQNPLCQNVDYKLDPNYGRLYLEIENSIKGVNHE